MNGSETTQTRSERRDVTENRQRILSAALRLFEQYGVEQVSMNQIATKHKSVQERFIAVIETKVNYVWI